MHQIKVIETLELLSSSQLRTLSQFLASPYHVAAGKSDSFQHLLQAITKGLKKKSLHKEALQQQFFPDKPYMANQKNAIDNLLTAFHKTVKDFIVWESLQSHKKQEEDYLLAKFYFECGKADRAWPHIRKAIRDWEKRNPKNHQDYFLRAELEELAYSYKNYEKVPKKEYTLPHASSFLNRGYLSKKWDFLAQQAYYEQILDQRVGDSQRVPLDAAVISRGEQAAADPPQVSLYYRAYNLMHNPTTKVYFTAFEEALLTHGHKLPSIEARNLRTLYRALLARAYNSNQGNEFLEQLFTAYQRDLAEGFINVHDKIPASTLLSMVKVGLKAKATEWVTKLLEEYPPGRIISTRYPEEFHRLCTAQVLVAQGKLAAAIDEVEHKLFEDDTYNLLADVVLIKVYYQENADLLHSRLRAMELKVRRMSLPEGEKAAYLNFISIVRRTYKYKITRNDTRLTKINAQVNESQELIEREWLLYILQQKPPAMT